MNVPMEEPSPIDMGGQVRIQNCLIFVNKYCNCDNLPQPSAFDISYYQSK